LLFRPLSRVSLAARSFSSSSLAFSSEPPALDKPATDDAEAFIFKAAQRFLWVSYRFLQPDFSQLSLDGALHSTQWLLPTPEQIKPSTETKALLNSPNADPELEARRLEILNCGKLGAKYGKFPSFKAVQERVKQGYSLDQAIVLYYYQRYGAPQDRVVTLAELYARINDDELVYDPVMGELQDIWNPPSAAEVSRIEEANPDAAATLRSLSYQSAADFNATTQAFLQVHDLDSVDFSRRIPTLDEVKELPEGLDKQAHLSARDQYQRTVIKPIEHVFDQYVKELKTLASYERKACENYMSQSVKEWKRLHQLNSEKPAFRTPGFEGDAELAFKLSGLLTELEHPQSATSSQ